MDEKISENGVIEDKNEYKFSWRKLCSWIALAFVTTSPLVGIGLAIMCISNSLEDEKEEVCFINYIVLMVGALLLINDMVVTILF